MHLRRALLVYTNAAVRLRKNPTDVSPDTLQKTAKLFRSFGEDYHEKKLEEEFIFPLIKQKGASGDAAKYPDVLTAQHNRGREITEYILSVTNGAKIQANAGALAETLDSFVWMYQNHAAREDTIADSVNKVSRRGEEGDEQVKKEGKEGDDEQTTAR